MVGEIGRIRSTIIDRMGVCLVAVLSVSNAAVAEPVSNAQWVYFDEAADARFAVWTENTEAPSITFAFRYNVGNGFPPVLVSGMKPAPMREVEFDQSCFSTHLAENFENTTSAYLVCFRDDNLLLTKLEFSGSGIMPDYLILGLVAD